MGQTTEGGLTGGTDGRAKKSEPLFFMPEPDTKKIEGQLPNVQGLDMRQSQVV